jgi:hypothetical protein
MMSQVGTQTGPGGSVGGSSADEGDMDLLTRAPAHFFVGSVNRALLETVGIVSRAMPNWLRDMSASEAIAWLSAFGVFAGLFAGAVRSRRQEIEGSSRDHTSTQRNCGTMPPGGAN